jgi:peroxiredoxin
LEFSLAKGGTTVVPDDLDGSYSVVLFYRGEWCSFCSRQLKCFQRSLNSFTDQGIDVIAASADSRQDAQAAIDEHGVEFPVAYDLDVPAVSESIGAFFDPNPDHVDLPHLQSTGFILDPSGTIVVSVYSSGAIGRLDPADSLGMIDHFQSNA